MKKLLYLACLCCVLVYLSSCKKKDEVSNEGGKITIYGNVIDRATGLPLYNVLIQEKNKVGGSTVTGNDGNYEFTLPINGSSNGKFFLIASKDQYSSAEYELNLNAVDKNRRIKIDFQLSKAFLVYTGKVLDSKGNPIADAIISGEFYNQESYGWESIGSITRTDENGNYILNLPPPSKLTQWDYKISSSKDDYRGISYQGSQSIADMGKITTINFSLTSNANNKSNLLLFVYGKVTDKYGVPITNATIKHWSSQYSFTNTYLESTVRTDTHGEYEIETKTSIGHGGFATLYYTFECTAPGYKLNTITHKTDWYDDAGKSFNFDFILTK